MKNVYVICERASGAFSPTGTAVKERLSYNSTFIDIATDERVVFTYDLTRLTRTEQYAYLAYTADGQQDIAHLKGSTTLQLNALAAALTKTLRNARE
jgi:hypothetical protein